MHITGLNLAANKYARYLSEKGRGVGSISNEFRTVSHWPSAISRFSKEYVRTKLQEVRIIFLSSLVRCANFVLLVIPSYQLKETLQIDFVSQYAH